VKQDDEEALEQSNVIEWKEDGDIECGLMRGMEHSLSKENDCLRTP